jgi:uncharacterized Zn finger protein
VYYLLGEEFDRDPFLIFQLRGMERSELLAALGPAAIPRRRAAAAARASGDTARRRAVAGEEGERSCR